MVKSKTDIISRLARGERAVKKVDPTTALLLRDAREMLERYKEQLAITEAQLRAALRFNHANRVGKNVRGKPKESAKPLRRSKK